MSTPRTLTTPDGRTVGYADFGPADGTPVIWCHGGPGSRLEPTQVAAEAAAAGFRMIGVDRPGYRLSTPRPGRSIADWVPDGLAVLDALDVEKSATIGVDMFAHGMVGYVDDRLADGVGWVWLDTECGAGADHRSARSRGFDRRRRPVQHTASLVPQAPACKIVDGLAHLSIVTKVPETLTEL